MKLRMCDINVFARCRLVNMQHNTPAAFVSRVVGCTCSGRLSGLWCDEQFGKAEELLGVFACVQPGAAFLADWCVRLCMFTSDRVAAAMANSTKPEACSREALPHVSTTSVPRRRGMDDEAEKALRPAGAEEVSEERVPQVARLPSQSRSPPRRLPVCREILQQFAP